MKQNNSARQTDELINRITNLRETLGVLNEESDSLVNKNLKQECINSPEPELNKVLINSHSPEKQITSEKQFPDEHISIAEHEEIVRQEINRVESYYKNILLKNQAENEARFNLLKDEYELRLENVEKNSIGKDEDLQKFIEAVFIIRI